jgi:hypothetical protein
LPWAGREAASSSPILFSEQIVFAIFARLVYTYGGFQFGPEFLPILPREVV